MVRILIYPLGGGMPLTVDLEGPDALADALVLDLRPTDAENVLKGGATEYSFDAPQTPSNRAIFDDWQHYQRDAGTAYLYRDAVLEVNGFPARLGKIALMSTTDDVARLTMFFDSEDPFRNLQDLRVNELDWDVVQNTTIAGMYVSAGFFTGSSNVVVAPAKLRSWPVDGNGDRVVTNADFYPCISVKSLFYQAFQRTTPTAPVSIDYLAQWSDSKAFERLVIFLNKNRDYDKEYLRRLYGVYAGAPSPFTITAVFPAAYVPMDFLSSEAPPFYDNNGDWSVIPATQARYTAPYAGTYNFNITIKTDDDFIGIVGVIACIASLNGSPYPVQQSPSLVNNAATFTFTFANIQMVAGDTMDFRYSFVGGPFPITILSAVINIEMQADSYAAGSTPMITGAWVPSDLTVADVMRDVFRMFNLRMFWDNVRQTLAIAPARRWYNQLDNATYSGFMAQPEVDWTDRVVEPPQEVIVERWAWDYWTVYGEPADAWLKAQSALSEVPSTGGRINTGRYGSQRNQVEMEGKAMAHIFDNTVTAAGPRVLFPMLLREDHTLDPVGQTSLNEDDSLFYLYVSAGFYNSEGADYGFTRTYEITNGNTLGYALNCATQVPYDWDSNANILNRPSLAFGDEISVNGNPIPGLLSNYHYGTLTSANNGKYMKAQIRLSSVDLQTYTFDRAVRISSRLFEVLRINGKPAESDIYEVELRTIDYPDATALSWLQNPNTPSYLTYDADPE